MDDFLDVFGDVLALVVLMLCAALAGIIVGKFAFGLWPLPL